jgi:Flp pilus assembly protein TadG
MIPKPARTLRALRSSEHGAIAPLFALLLLAMLGLVGLVVDGSAAREAQLELQSAAEAAALAGATALPDVTAAKTRAVDYARTNLPQAIYGDVVTAAQVENGTWSNGAFTAGGATALRVTASRTAAKGNAVSPAFMKMFGFATLDISTSAVAALPSQPVCVLVLDAVASPALELKSNSGFNLNSCGVHVNSMAGGALAISSNAGIQAGYAKVAGGVSDTSTGTITPAAQTGAAQMADPYAALPAPPTAGCGGGTNVVLDSVTTTRSPGVYCGGLTIKGNANVTFNPGVYVIKDNDFLIDSNSRVQGAGVFFYLHGTGNKFHFDSNSILQLSAPTSGVYAGVLFFAARDNAMEHRIDSNTSAQVSGTMYLPNSTGNFNSNVNIGSSSACFRLIARRATFDSNAALNLPAPSAACPNNFGGSSATTITIVR